MNPDSVNRLFLLFILALVGFAASLYRPLLHDPHVSGSQVKPSAVQLHSDSG